ncbi:MAG TPA: hypothetical protein VF766_05095 [Pyrinomonadaceae bacterium]
MRQSISSDYRRTGEAMWSFRFMPDPLPRIVRRERRVASSSHEILKAGRAMPVDLKLEPAQRAEVLTDVLSSAPANSSGQAAETDFVGEDL